MIPRLLFRSALPLVALLALAMNTASAPAQESSSRVGEMLQFYLEQDAFTSSATLSFNMGYQQQESAMPFHVDRTNGVYRRLSPEGAFLGTSTIFDGQIVQEEHAGKFRLRTCYPGLSTFLEQDVTGYMFFVNHLVAPVSDFERALTDPTAAIALDRDEDTPAGATRFLVEGEQNWRLTIADGDQPLLLMAEAIDSEGEASVQLTFADWTFGDEARANRPEMDLSSNRRRIQMMQEAQILDNGPHRLIGKGDQIAAGMDASGQLHMYQGRGKIVLQPIWRFDSEVPEESLRGTLGYLGMLQQLERDYAAQGVAIVGLLSGGQTEFERFQQAIKGLDWTFEFLVDEERLYSRAYGVVGFPTLVLVDSTGQIDSVYTGWSDCSETLIRDDIERLIRTSVETSTR